MATISEQTTLLQRFNDAFTRHDVDGIMQMMTEDCVFENTWPAPDGTRYEGQAAVRRFWEEFFAAVPSARFEIEVTFVHEDHAAQLWTYHWISPEGIPSHVRGVDIFRFRAGLIAEKLSYIKGWARRSQVVNWSP